MHRARCWQIAALAFALLSFGAPSLDTLHGEDVVTLRTARTTRRADIPPEEIARRAFKPLSEIRVEAQLNRPEMPEDTARNLFSAPVSASRTALQRDAWNSTLYMWTPPEYFYRPLYLEEAPLERYGQSACPRLQPVLSGAHFFGSSLLLPYTLAVRSPRQWESPLGYDRPGSYADPVRERLVTRPGEIPRRVVVEPPFLDGQ